MKALSSRNDAPEQASRPFDKERDGFVLGDGAAVVVLESLTHARNRGRHDPRRSPRIRPFRRRAPHDAAGACAVRGAQRAMPGCLADGKIDPTTVDYINAHGTSTELGDIAETQAVKAVFGDHARKLVFGSSKSMTGHLLGGAGGLEFVVSLLAARPGKFPPPSTR